jgi:DNA-binding transcriptional ArsR family regulator
MNSRRVIRSRRLPLAGRLVILNDVLKYVDPLDLVFRSLADPTRRQLIERLSRGEMSVSQLATPLPMSLPAVMQHLRLLEQSGLVASDKAGRIRTCRLQPDRLQLASDWTTQRRNEWESRLDRLDTFLNRTDPNQETT